MEVFQCCGEGGVLKICLDDGETVSLRFKNKVEVSVSYNDDATTAKTETEMSKADPPQGLKTEVLADLTGGEENGTSTSGDPLDEELNGFMERVKNSEQDGGNIFQNTTEEELFSENKTKSVDTTTTTPATETESRSESADVIDKGAGITDECGAEQKVECEGNDIKVKKVDEIKKDLENGRDEKDDNDDATVIDSEEDFGDYVGLSEEENGDVGENVGKQRQGEDNATEEEKGEMDSSAMTIEAKDERPKTEGVVEKQTASAEKKYETKNSNSDVKVKASTVSPKMTVELRPRKAVDSSKQKVVKEKKSPRLHSKGRKILTLYKCNICGGQFKDGHSLSLHQRAPSYRLKCSMCDLECMSKANLIVHKHLMHSAAWKKNGKLCPICSQPFQNHSDILQHIRLDHTKEGLYRCCACLALFQTYPTFKSHLDYFTLHKHCDKKRPNAISPNSKPSEQRALDLSIHQTLKEKLAQKEAQLRSLMNLHLPKPNTNTTTPSAVAGKKRHSQMPVKRPVHQMPIKRPVDPKLVKRPIDQVTIRRPSAQPPLKRPLDQMAMRILDGQPILKKPFIQTPLDKALAKKPAIGKPLLLYRQSANQWKSKKPIRPLKKPLQQPSPSTTTSTTTNSNNNNSDKTLTDKLPNQKHCSFQLLPSQLPTDSPTLTKDSTRKPKRSYTWDKLWKCHFCERVFRCKGDYISHKKPSRISQTCKQCGFTSTSKALYLIHQYQKHTNYLNDRYTIVNEDLRCHICEESIGLNEVLNHIMTTHTGEHPYECCVCKHPSLAYEDWVKHGKCHVRSAEEKNSLKAKKLLLHLTIKMGVPEKSDQLYCNACKKYFQTEKDFMRHHKSETERKECDLCETVCHTEAGYMVHRYITHGLSHGQTPTADSRDEPATNLLRMWHEDDATNDCDTEKTKCPSCSESFAVKDVLYHVMVMHTDESPYKCCACKTTVPNLDEYIDHCKFHLGKSPYDRGCQRCLICGLRFDCRIRLSRHKVMHKPHCSFCDIDFSSKALLEVHLKNQHTSDMTACGFCAKLFADMNQLAEHERNHYFFKKSPCPTCGLMVTNVNKHLARRHPKEDLEFLCNLCGRKFPFKRDLARHMTTVHSTDRHYECDICKKTFKRSSGLRRHAQSHLKVRKMFECHICGKKCSQRNNLSVHMRIHASVKAFTCEHCGQGFNYNQSLQTHIKKKHATPGGSTTTPLNPAAAATRSESSTSAAALMESMPPPVNAADDNADAQPRGIPISVTSVFPEHPHPHPLFPDPTQHFYPADPSGYIVPAVDVNSFQRSYTEMINNIVRPDHHGTAATTTTDQAQQQQQQQQQGYHHSVFYPQY